MTKDQAQKLLSKIDWDGLDVAMKRNWSEIEDSEFHVLQNNYIKATAELTRYIDNLVDEFELGD